MTITPPPSNETALCLKAKHYNDLVWYARSNPDNQLPKVQEERKRIERCYPKEIAALNCGGDNWDHGFNSGCLAAFRYALTLLDEDTWVDEETCKEMPCGGYVIAEDAFPSLDT